MELHYDPPPGHPNPPPVQQPVSTIGWIISALFVVGVVSYLAYSLGWI